MANRRVEELRQILHDEEMKVKWKPIRKRNRELVEKEKKRIEDLIANDRAHLISKSRYWPPISDLSRIREHKYHRGLDMVGDTPVEYPSGYEWMHMYKPYADAVVMHTIKVIAIFSFFAFIMLQ